MPMFLYLTNTKFQKKKKGKSAGKEETNKPNNCTTLELTNFPVVDARQRGKKKKTESDSW